jgi:hypothetical protein
MIGNTDAIKKWLKNHPAKDSENSLCAKACLAFFEGNNKKAITAYDKALPLIQTKTKKSPRVFNHLMGVFYVLALFKDSGKKSLENADRYIRQVLFASIWIRIKSRINILMAAHPPKTEKLQLMLSRQVRAMFFLSA